MIGHGQSPFRSQPMPISPLVWVHSFIEPDLFGPQCTVRQYHSDLSDQFALKIRVRIRVREKMHYFSILHGLLASCLIYARAFIEYIYVGAFCFNVTFSEIH